MGGFNNLSFFVVAVASCKSHQIKLFSFAPGASKDANERGFYVAGAVRMKQITFPLDCLSTTKRKKERGIAH